MKKNDNKEIQKKRMIRYFINSAKELIIEEGLNNINTKKIGDRAGYSYATIYNYFENYNELICICIEEFSLDMKEYLSKKADEIPNNIEKLTKIMELSIDYVLNNSNIYNLFLTNSIDFNYFQEKRNKRFVHPAYDLLIELIKEIKEFSILSEKEIYNFADLILSLFHTKIQFYFTLKYPKDVLELKKDILNNLEFLISRVNCKSKSLKLMSE